MSQQIEQQTTALAAVVQAAAMVEHLARTGEFKVAESEPLIAALFKQSPETFAEIYGPTRQLSLGFNQLNSILGMSKQRISPDTARYAVSLLHLESKLRKQHAMLNQLGQGIQAASRQSEHFGLLHENTLASLAELYKETLSHLSYRIQVIGNPTYLQNANTANKVRTLLLAGIRAAILWRQAGGRRWHLMFKRNALHQATQRLLAE